MKTRLYAAGILGGLALLAATAVVVFAFGRHNPSPPSLRDEPRPEIPGELLYLDEDSCFRRAAGSGAAETRLGCMPDYFGGPIYWIDDATAGIVQYGPSGALLYDVDLATAQVSQAGRPVSIQEKTPPPFGQYGGAYAPDGAFAFFEEEGELILLVGGERTEIADFDVPRYNQPQVALWSPDSQWILVQYHPPRANGPELWIIRRDGSVRGTLTKDARSGPGGLAAWRIGDSVSPRVPE